MTLPKITRRASTEEMQKLSRGRGKGHFNVRPRYTCGSPAMVPENIARLVAEQEERQYRDILEGMTGEDSAAEAAALGLHGIAQFKMEHKGGWLIMDLITGSMEWSPLGFNGRRVNDLGAAEFTARFEVRDADHRVIARTYNAIEACRIALGDMDAPSYVPLTSTERARR